MGELTTTDLNELEDRKRRRRKRRPATPTVSAAMEDDGSARVTIGEERSELEVSRFIDALGIADGDMLQGFIGQIGNSVSKSRSQIDQDAFRFAIGFVKAVEPRDEIETALAAQMAAAHICAMDSSRRYLQASMWQGKDSAERAMNKFARTYVAQMEALKKHRQKAQQTVRVERVTVNEGGQAIVGSVTTGGGNEET